MPPVREQLLNPNLDNPIDSVLEFLDGIPDCLQEIFEYHEFIQICEDSMEPELFMGAFYEAKEVLQSELKLLRGLLQDERTRTHFLQRLASIGFTGQSLKMKAWILNQYDKARRRTREIYEEFMKNLRIFLKQLNVFLDSLSEVIPSLHAMKEVKDTGEIMIDAYTV